MLFFSADSVRLKCDALPYRTAYVGTQCFFVDSKEVFLLFNLIFIFFITGRIQQNRCSLFWNLFRCEGIFADYVLNVRKKMKFAGRFESAHSYLQRYDD